MALSNLALSANSKNYTRGWIHRKWVKRSTSKKARYEGKLNLKNGRDTNSPRIKFFSW